MYHRPLTFSPNFGIIQSITPMAVTEESTLAEAAREAGAQTETPARGNPAEVPSRAAWGNAREGH